MRRTLALSSVGLTVLGLELTTKAVSLTLARLLAGFSALRSGIEFHVSTPRFAAGVAILGTGMVLMAVLWWVGQSAQGVVSIGRTCPSCGARTSRLKRRNRHRLLGLFMGRRLVSRLCEHCGWTGLTVKQ